MAASDLAIWIEIAASEAALVTLVFLTVQIRQSNALMHSEARQAQVINDQEHLYQIIQHPDIAASFAAQGEIRDDEKTRLMFWIVASMRPPGLPIGRSYPLHSVLSGHARSGISARRSSIRNS